MVEIRHVARPADPSGTGVLVLAGSSGTVPSRRADLLAQHGATAVALRWFGGPGQQPGPFDVPIELFVKQLDHLANDHDHLAIVGTSFGAEAALVTAALARPHIAVVAIAPTAHVWPGVRPDGTTTSHWTEAGTPVPHLDFLEDWHPTTDPPSFLDRYRRSLAAAPKSRRAAARIPVERITGDVILVAGGDDLVWPSASAALTIVEHRTPRGLATTVLTQPGAGHRVVLPGEGAATGGMPMQRGGTPADDAALGRKAWPHIARALRLHTR